MKKIIVLSSLGTLIIPLVLYLLHFNSGFSYDDSNWSNFGSYYGGIVSSVFAFLSFIFLISSYYEEKNRNYESDQDQLFFKNLDLAEKIYNKTYYELNGIQFSKSQVFSNFRQANLQMGYYIEDTNTAFKGIAKGKINAQQKNYYDNRYKPLIDTYMMSQNQVVIYCNHINHILEMINIRMPNRKKEYYDLLFSIFSKDDLYVFIFTHYRIIQLNTNLEEIIVNKLNDKDEYEQVLKLIPKIEIFKEYSKIFA